MARIDAARLSGQRTRANTRLFRNQADLAGILIGRLWPDN